MRAENLPGLDVYIDDYIGATTTRHASEEKFICPPIAEAVVAERTMRLTLHAMYDSHISFGSVERPVEAKNLDRIKEEYWRSAKHADAAHGARPDFVLDDYFRVSRNRSYETIRTSILAENAPDSIPAKLFGVLDAYQHGLGVDSVTSSRLATNLFNASLPTIKKNALALQEGA